MSINQEKRTVRIMYPNATLLRVKFDDQEDGTMKVIKVYRVSDEMVLQETSIVK